MMKRLVAKVDRNGLTLFEDGDRNGFDLDAE